MGVPRGHHLLPQFYMRAFANSREQVRVVDRSTGRDFTAKTTNVFVERDYYTVSSVDAEDDPGLIEGLYSQVETIASADLRARPGLRLPARRPGSLGAGDVHGVASDPRATAVACGLTWA